VPGGAGAVSGAVTGSGLVRAPGRAARGPPRTGPAIRFGGASTAAGARPAGRGRGGLQTLPLSQFRGHFLVCRAVLEPHSRGGFRLRPSWKPRATLRWKTTSNASITPQQPGSTATATSVRRCLPEAAYQPWHHASRTPSHADTHPPANLRLPAPPVMSSSLPPEPATPAVISSPITKRDRRAAFLGRAVPRLTPTRRAGSALQ
jgi:hypothetical protein